MPRLERRALLILAGSAVLAAATGCTNGIGPGQQHDPPPARPAPSPTPTRIVVPSVVGLNASDALDMLRNLGFTNIDLGTVDGNIVVLVPEHWTVRTQTPPPGQLRQHGTKIVLGCAKNP
jgi:hypothetical protein